MPQFHDGLTEQHIRKYNVYHMTYFVSIFIGNYSTCQKMITYANTSLSDLFPPRKGKSRSIRHRKFNALSHQLCCNARDTVLQLSEDAPKRIDKPLLNMLKFWLRGKRRPRRQKNYAERDPHPIGKVEHQKALSVASD